MFGMWHGLKKWLKQETKQDQLVCPEFGLQKSPQHSFEFNQLPQELQRVLPSINNEYMLGICLNTIKYQLIRLKKF